jgi:hypothetical protein
MALHQVKGLDQHDILQCVSDSVDGVGGLEKADNTILSKELKTLKESGLAFLPAIVINH